jgi:hypothetical protein
MDILTQPSSQFRNLTIPSGMEGIVNDFLELMQSPILEPTQRQIDHTITQHKLQSNKHCGACATKKDKRCKKCSMLCVCNYQAISKREWKAHLQENNEKASSQLRRTNKLFDISISKTITKVTPLQRVIAKKKKKTNQKSKQPPPVTHHPD